jgi:hypothetical protein
MEFRLVYDGPLKSNRGVVDKHALRRHFHLQLQELVNRKAMAHFKRMLEVNQAQATFRAVGEYTFIPLITEKLNNVAELHITLLTPEEPGRSVTQAGDLDNRLKTLLDALRTPKNLGELPQGAKPEEHEKPFFCLLEDDALISGLSVVTDRLLVSAKNSTQVLLVIHVVPKSTTASIGAVTWTV